LYRGENAAAGVNRAFIVSTDDGDEAGGVAGPHRSC